jgi:hypothetical protein
VLSLMVIGISDRTSQLFLAPVAKSQFNMTSFMGVHKLTSKRMSDGVLRRFTPPFFL